MDVKTKQKSKKRRTRKNLDDLRERSRRGAKNNVNKNCENKYKSMSKYNNELITSKRLTLSMFNKAIRSKTVTRLPFTRVDNTSYRNGNIVSSIQTMSPRSQKPIYAISTICENNTELEHSTVNKLFKKHASENVDSKNEPPSFSLSHNEFVSVDDSPEECNYKCEYLNNLTSDSNSEVESIHCYYEKFMNELPIYLEEHFPALSKNFVNVNLIYLKQNYLENRCQEEESNNSLDNDFRSVDTLKHHITSSIIQNPKEYIQTRLSWEQSVKTKSILLPNSSTPSPMRESHSSGIFLDSPDYQYFPHKLNQ